MPSPSPQPPDIIRVLLIEDNPGDVFLISEILAGAPVRFAIESAERLAAALERLARGGIDVILSDLTLPDSHGFETFERLHASAAQTPIIVLSGLSDESMALRTVERGAQDYLVKGQVDQALLVRSIRYAIRRAEADRALAEERNLLRSVINNLVDAIYVKDASGHYILGNNEHARQLKLPSPAEVIGKTTADLFPPEVAAKFRADDEAVMSTGQPIINRHEEVTEPDSPRRWLSTTKVPLRDTAGEVIGIVGIGRDITARKEAEEKLKLYTLELEDKNQQMEGDLEMAREVQQAFLPQVFPCFPHDAAPGDSALRFYREYLPTTALGGDFFHIIPISDTEAGVLICDVMGHGVRAALVTAIQRALVEELGHYADDPGAFLTEMNVALVSILRRTRNPMFASAFYVVVDVQNSRMRYANAGHPRPLHVRRRADEVVLLDHAGQRPGPALGVFENSRYTTQERPLTQHDLIILFTDGLYEVENARGELYDQNLLLETVARQVQRPADCIFAETLEEVRAFSATHEFEDDVCMVGVEVWKTAPKRAPDRAAPALSAAG